MPELGKTQDLIIVKETTFGVYLGDTPEAGPDERVLLPKKQVPEGAKTGDSVEVFIYRDSEDRLIATTARPLITLHSIARLAVREVTRIGAFLDWGLEKDLLLPFKEQTRKVQQGEEILVGLYIDKSDRLAATMKLYPYLKSNAPYRVGDEAEGTIYEVSPHFGVYVAVEDTYSGRIPPQEAQGSYTPGERMTFRVTAVKEDGKLDLSARKKGYLQLDDDAVMVMDVIRGRYEGKLPFDDHADPEKIREVFGLSKAAFKRAVGHLLKEGEVTVENGTITAKGE